MATDLYPQQAHGTIQAAGSGTALAPDAMRERIAAALEDRLVDTKLAYGQLTITLEPEVLVDAARLCKEDPVLAFDLFDFLCGVDLAEAGFAVVTHLYSTAHLHHVFLRVVADGGREQPTVPSLTSVYRGANWHEREAYDMFGIEFEGHPGLLPRILTVENFEGWPLRKEFLLSTREAKPWPGLKEPKEVGEDEADDDQAAPAGPSAEEKAEAAKAKAERAKAKAAEMRKKKAAQRAEEQQAEAAEETKGGDTEGAAAAAAAVAAGDETAQSAEGAAEVAQTDSAKDAAAGAASGDTAKGAPQDRPGEDEPVTDEAEERRVGAGSEGSASGTPGVEAEGRHTGAKEQTGDRPAAETPGMTSDTESAEAARTAAETPAPGPESDVQTAGTRGDEEAEDDEEETTDKGVAEGGGSE